jgi:hypothetical protein
LQTLIAGDFFAGPLAPYCTANISAADRQKACLSEGDIREWRGSERLKKRPGSGIGPPEVWIAKVIDGHGFSLARGMNESMTPCINAHMEIVFLIRYGEKYQIPGQHLVLVDPPSLAELLPGGSGHRNARSLVCIEYQAAAVKSLTRRVSAPAIWGA